MEKDKAQLQVRDEGEMRVWKRVWRRTRRSCR